MHLLGTGVKIALVGAHFHGFGVARQGPWITWRKIQNTSGLDPIYHFLVACCCESTLRKGGGAHDGRKERFTRSRKISAREEAESTPFIRLVGTGVGISFMPAFLASLGAASSAQTITTGKPTILSGEEYPIGLWSPPPPTETTEERYQEIAAA